MPATKFERGTIGHYKQSYTQFYKYFDPKKPIEDIDEQKHLPEYQLSVHVLVKKANGEYVSVMLTQEDTSVVLVYVFGKEFVIPNSYFESTDGLVLFGNLEHSSTHRFLSTKTVTGF